MLHCVLQCVACVLCWCGCVYTSASGGGFECGCTMVQYVIKCCRVLQSAAVFCSVCCSVLWGCRAGVAACVPQLVVVALDLVALKCCRVLQCIAACC